MNPITLKTTVSVEIDRAQYPTVNEAMRGLIHEWHFLSGDVFRGLERDLAKAYGVTRWVK